MRKLLLQSWAAARLAATVIAMMAVTVTLGKAGEVAKPGLPASPASQSNKAAPAQTSTTPALATAANPTAKLAEKAARVSSAPTPYTPLVHLSIEFGGDAAVGFSLLGSDARQQLLVSGADAAGKLYDLTRDVHFMTEPAGIVQITPTGEVIPLADGKATITASDPQGLKSTAPVSVSHMSSPVPVNFANQIVPIFTKLGCNAGGCHGKSTGQNGFRLSLLGFEPTEDYEHLVKEGHGRRLFPAVPSGA